jgi:RNA polymerase sigma-70 factor (ECF subfamily)
MSRTPSSLLERLRLPADQAAWSRFVKLYTPLIYHWVRRLGASEPDAADLVQEVLTLLVQKLPAFEYDRQKRFRGWLWTVTLNLWRGHRRRLAGVRVDLPFDELSEPAIPDGVEALSEAEYRQYLVGRAMKLMQAEFEPSTWKAFWEYVVLDKPAAVVAGELGLSVDSVYAAKSRVLRHLRQELDGLLD